MRSLKSIFIFGLAVFLLLGLVGCKKLDLPTTPDLPDPTPEPNPYPREISGEFDGTPSTLTGNRFEITMKSVEFKKTIQGISGNTWRTKKRGFGIYRFHIKHLIWAPEVSPVGLSTPFLIPDTSLESPDGRQYGLSGDGATVSTFLRDCFPGEKAIQFQTHFLAQGEEADYVSVNEVSDYAWQNVCLIAVFWDHYFLVRDQKEQWLKFQFTFRLNELY